MNPDMYASLVGKLCKFVWNETDEEGHTREKWAKGYLLGSIPQMPLSPGGALFIPAKLKFRTLPPPEGDNTEFIILQRDVRKVKEIKQVSR